MSNIFPFVLSGGAGVRLWPLSRRDYPKQFLSLAGKQSLLQQSCQRLDDPVFAAPSILCNNEHRFLVAEQLLQLDLPWSQIIPEPVSRNTAPAALIATLLASKKDKEALVLLMPSDHTICDKAVFHKAIKKGIKAATKGHIVTFGIKPNSPHTGYGYIETINGTSDALEVSRFVEKPSKSKAEEYLQSDNFFWNAGIFLFSAKTMINTFKSHSPSIWEQCQLALENAEHDLGFLRLDQSAYEQCDNISLDYAIMQKATNIKCVPFETDWSDIGDWASLWDIGVKDENHNVTHGDVMLFDTKNSYIHTTDNTSLSVIGLDDVIAVSTGDAVLLAAKDRVQDVKIIVEKLKQNDRKEADHHIRVYRPWGWFEQATKGHRFQVKCLNIKPGAYLSLQSHQHRAEHWVVVSGTVEVTKGDKTFLMTENESTYIPNNEIHRLGNPGNQPAQLIEVQTGAYIGEDDIIRYEDDFDRKIDSRASCSPFSANENPDLV